ncbi:MAG: hypothetical protein LAP87_25060 [Acidobacteriia bacterium]|nr:hypothetical protein [Terriglobia bacterium]
MSEDEKDAVLGKVMRQYVAEKRELAFMAENLHGVAATLKALGALLHELPRSDSLEPVAAWQEAKKSPMIDTGQIAGLLKEYHVRRNGLVELRKQLVELGIPDPDPSR